MLARRELVDALGQFHILRIGHYLIAGVGEFAQLLFDGGHQFGVTVARVQYSDTGSEVDIASAFHVP